MFSVPVALGDSRWVPTGPDLNERARELSGVIGSWKGSERELSRVRIEECGVRSSGGEKMLVEMGVSWMRLGGERVKFWPARGSQSRAISRGSTGDGGVGTLEGYKSANDTNYTNEATQRRREARAQRKRNLARGATRTGVLPARGKTLAPPSRRSKLLAVGRSSSR
jgi:hypothetical protein